MRILASNPDTIGDMVLRQPMYAALRTAGHELTLIVRPAVAPLAERVAPGAKVLLLPAEVYSDDLDARWPAFDELFRAARDFGPDVLLVAPFRWTRFEERLAEELKDVPGLRRFGMSGRLYAGDPYAGSPSPSRLTFDVTAGVAEELPEVEKNAALAAAVLGAPVESVSPVEPRIEATQAEMDEARRILAGLGLEAGGYWVACVTGTANVPIKAWPERNWAELLSRWPGPHDRRFLFVGLPGERPAAEAVRRGMADPDRTRLWMEEGGTLSQLIGLTALSAGYAGHDTGPMHLAAALGRPVLAVFGGGHGTRFFPRGAGGSPGVALMVGVPCAGCAWTCAFETSHCVKDVPVQSVLQAAQDLEGGRVAGPEARVLEPSVELRDRMIREAMAFSRQRIRDAGDLSRQLRAQDDHVVRPMRTALDQRLCEAHDLSVRLAERESAAARLQGTVDRLSTETADLTGRLRETEAGLTRLSAERAELSREASVLRQGAAARDDEVARLARRVRELELVVPPPPPAPRPWRRPWRPWRLVLTDWVTGGRDYVPGRTPPPLPKIMVVAMVPALPDPGACDRPNCRGEGCGCPGSRLAGARRTLDSALLQDYPRVEVVVAPVRGPTETGGADGDAPWPPLWLEPYRGRVSRVMEPAAGWADALAKALASSGADVIGWLEAGDVFEPAGLWHVGEFFRDHPRAMGAVFEETIEWEGWRYPRRARHRTRGDVYSLLSCDDRNEPRSVFLRRIACAGIGEARPVRGGGAKLDLLLRFSRRHGLPAAPGQVTCVDPRRSVVSMEPAAGRGGEAAKATKCETVEREREWAAAAEAFRATFGLAGRARCRAVHLGIRLREAFGRVAGGPRLTFTPPALPAAVPPLEPADPLADDGGARPLTGRPPDRLLFGAPDAAGRARLFYHDPAAGIAWATGGPAAGQTEAPEAEARRRPFRQPETDAATTAGTGPAGLGPWAEYRGGPMWARWLAGVEMPTTAAPDEAPTAGPAADPREFLAALAGLTGPADPALSLLHAGCGDGSWLDALKPMTRWKPAGTEADPAAASAARSRGYDVWQTSPADAAGVLPLPRRFDLIFIDPGTSESLSPGDLLMTLRRLRQVLQPGGRVVLAGPNLDSALLDLFGPTWAGWHDDRRRTFLGRRGIAHLAALADLSVERFQTRTPAAGAARSAVYNRLGLGAGPDCDAPRPDDRRRGARLASWARLLWDWRGKGDTFCAVLKAQ